MLAVWEDPETRPVCIGLLRSALSNERAAAMMREFVTSTILSRIADILEGEDVELRASLAGSHMIGALVARHVVGVEPLASMSPDDLARRIGPALGHYLLDDGAKTGG